MEPLLATHRARARAARLAFTAVVATAAVASTATAAGAHTRHPLGFFADPSAYTVAGIAYSSSAIRRDHDTSTGALDFIDSQSTSARLRAGGRTFVSSSLNVFAIEAPLAGATNGTMTRYYQGSTVGSCTYALALHDRGDALRIVLTRHGATVGVTLIVVNNEGGNCAATGGDAEALNWYLPGETLRVSAFAGNIVVLHTAGTHVDYPSSPSNNTWQWSLTVKLRRR